jgi:DNA-binding IclR family transcriptional regulator
MTDGPSGASVKTTRTSLDILQIIRREKGADLNGIADELNKATSTVHRHLRTLQRAGFVTRYGETFHLGLKFLDFGEYVRSQWPLQAIEDAVSQLNDETGEEVDFLTEDRGRVITIGKSYRKYHRMVRYSDSGDDSDPERRRSEVGNYYHMHVTGAGKAILAEFPDRKVERIIDQWGLPARTENTLTSETELFAELEQIRERGYAISDGEYAEGLRSVAKVVENPNGGVFGALNVAGPTYRMNGVVLEREIPNALEEASEALEEAIVDRSSVVERQPLGST